MSDDGPRRARDLAVVLPLAGTLTFAPPLVGLFARPAFAVFGVPSVILYLFGLWLALILGALLVSRRLARRPGEE